METPKFRVATDEERSYFTERLYPLQNRVFAVASTYEESLVLTGGTALARLYLGHRFSDDIDFFTAQPHAGRLGRDLANALIQSGLNVEPINATPDFFRAILSDGVTSVQLDVAPDSPRVVPLMRSALGVCAHGLRDLAANKISAYENRVEVKDAVDLFYLSKEVSWDQCFADAEKKRVPIAYEDLEHFLHQPLSGEALLTSAINPTEFDVFVDTLRSEIVREIKKKVAEARREINELTRSLLWDTPTESRNVNDRTRVVLVRRAQHLPLPQRIAVLDAVTLR